MNATITLDGEPATLADALDAYIVKEGNAQAEYAADGNIMLEDICAANVARAALLQEQLLHKLGRCEQHLTSGCADPLPHTICEV